MAKVKVQVTTVMFNSENPEELVRFWSSLLEVDAHPHNERTEHIWLMPQEPGGFKLGFQRVTKKSDAPAEIHIDLAVEDLDAVEARAVSLGAKVIKRTKLEMGFEWRVLEDPQGNPFCIFVPFGE